MKLSYALLMAPAVTCALISAARADEPPEAICTPIAENRAAPDLSPRLAEFEASPRLLYVCRKTASGEVSAIAGMNGPFPLKAGHYYEVLPLRAPRNSSRDVKRLARAGAELANAEQPLAVCPRNDCFAGGKFVGYMTFRVSTEDVQLYVSAWRDLQRSVSVGKRLSGLDRRIQDRWRRMPGKYRLDGVLGYINFDGVQSGNYFIEGPDRIVVTFVMVGPKLVPRDASAF